MLYLKACPRCNGDVHFAADIDGPYLQCLQCGFSRELVEMVSANKHTASGNEVKGESGTHLVSS